MDIKAQFCTFIGASAEELMRSVLAKIESYDNISGEGILINGYYIYEYFTITDGENTFRFSVRFYNASNGVMYVHVAGPSSSGGTGIATAQITRNTGIVTRYYNNGMDDILYTNCWFFSSGNNFVGMTSLYAKTQANQGSFLFLKNHEDTYMLIACKPDSGENINTYNRPYVYDSVVSRTYNVDLVDDSITTNTDARKQDTPDYVYIETRTYSDGGYTNWGILPDLYFVHNFMIYDSGATNFLKNFQLVGTEDGNYMHLIQDIFIKISEVAEKQIIKYEAS